MGNKNEILIHFKNNNNINENQNQLIRMLVDLPCCYDFVNPPSGSGNTQNR